MTKSKNNKNVRCSGQKEKKDNCSGFTMVEVSIAMALVVLMSAGLYAMGMQVRRSANRNRLATEARAFAKERLEEIVATGLENLAKPNVPLLEASQLTSATHYVITQTPRVVWHAADGSTVAAADADYAEVYVDVSYRSQHTSRTVTDTYAILIN